LSATPGLRSSFAIGDSGLLHASRDLETDLAALRDAGARAIVCLLESDEIVRYEIGLIGPAAEELGMEFHWIPLSDEGSAVSDTVALDQAADSLARLRDAGHAIAVVAHNGEPRLVQGAKAIARVLEPTLRAATASRIINVAVRETEGRINYTQLV
jgi:hypothetical protein